MTVDLACIWALYKLKQLASRIMITPFHLAIQVRDLNEARQFYCAVLGCTVGRSSDTWVDLNLFGHQLVCHLNLALADPTIVSEKVNPVDGHGVPVPHFGVVLEMQEWEKLAERLKQQGVCFAIEPYIRFQGQVGEQGTMFFRDPSGNALEFKAFQDIASQLFATD